MKKTLAALSALAFLSAPAFAGTPFAFTCDFGGEKVVRLLLDAEGGGSQLHNEQSYPILWFDQGDTTIIVDEEDPSQFIVSFVAETGEAMTPWEPGSLMEGHCRLGGE